MSFPDQPWSEGLPLQTEAALEIAMRHWLPPESFALYARWWQLETWLRQLVYVELRARDGKQWEQTVRSVSGRQSQDAQFRHMTSTDTENPLAYLDYSQLLDLALAGNRDHITAELHGKRLRHDDHPSSEEQILTGKESTELGAVPR